MARLPRLFIKDCSQHIIQRGNNRQVTFFADEGYTVYLDRLKDFSKKEIKGAVKFVSLEGIKALVRELLKGGMS
jgi:REP element-mobilizing transposase RayT